MRRLQPQNPAKPQATSTSNTHTRHTPRSRRQSNANVLERVGDDHALGTVIRWWCALVWLSLGVVPEATSGPGRGIRRRRLAGEAEAASLGQYEQ